MAGVAALLLCACGTSTVAVRTSGPSVGVAASCAAPSLAVQPRTAERGATIVVRGEHFVRDCYDVNPQPGQRARPTADVALTLRSGAHRYRLGSAHPTADGTFIVRLRVPSDALPGNATIETNDAPPTAIRVRR